MAHEGRRDAGRHEHQQATHETDDESDQQGQRASASRAGTDGAGIDEGRADDCHGVGQVQAQQQAQQHPAEEELVVEGRADRVQDAARVA